MNQQNNKFKDGLLGLLGIIFSIIGFGAFLKSGNLFGIFLCLLCFLFCYSIANND